MPTWVAQTQRGTDGQAADGVTEINHPPLLVSVSCILPCPQPVPLHSRYDGRSSSIVPWALRLLTKDRCLQVAQCHHNLSVAYPFPTLPLTFAQHSRLTMQTARPSSPPFYQISGLASPAARMAGFIIQVHSCSQPPA